MKSISFRRSAIALLIATSGGTASAQDPDDLSSYFEGRRVVVLIDLPATKDGVEIYPDSGDMDTESYADRLRRHGVAIHAGDREMVTLVKVKGDHIEFQFGGGGYGTFFDEDETVYVPYPNKSHREVALERDLAGDPDHGERRRLEKRLDCLRAERAEEYRRRQFAAEPLVELKRIRIAEKAAHSGSRFNLRFRDGVPDRMLTPAAVIAVLRDYVRFDDSGRADPLDDRGIDRDVDVSRSADGLRRGMAAADVEAVLGQPRSIEDGREGDLAVRRARYRHDRGDVEVTYVEGIVVGYHRI